MAATATAISSNQSVIQLDAPSTLTDISGSTTTVSITPERDSKETFVFGDENSIVTVGRTKVTIAVESVYSSTTSEAAYIVEAWFYGASAISRAARTVQIDIPNSSSGSRRFTGEVKVTAPPSVELDASKPDPLIVKYELMNDGAFSWTII